MKTFSKISPPGVLLICMLFLSLHPAFSQCPAVVDLGKDTTLCPGRSIILDAGLGKSYLWEDGVTTTRYRVITAPGTYAVTVFMYNCEIPGYDEIIITPAPSLTLDLILPVRPLPYFCKGETANLSSQISGASTIISYEWSVSNLNTNSINLDTTREVTLTITDQYGCKYSKTRQVEFQFPFERDSIKLVTYDPTEDKYILVYSRSLNKRTRAYILFNGYTDKDSLTTTSFSSSNLVVDAKSNPHLAPSFYNIQLVDSCLNRSALKLEKIHKPIHLKVTREKDGTTTLEWDRYIGFPYEYYYIARGTGPASVQVIDSVRHVPVIDRMVYNDKTNPNQLFYYAIFIKTPDVVYVENPGKKTQAGPFVHSLSNLEDNRLYGTGIRDLTFLDEKLKVFPNPFSDRLTISYEIDATAEVSIEICDITGRKVALIDDTRKNPGKYELTFSASVYGCSPGIYYLRYMVKGTGVITRKIVLE